MLADPPAASVIAAAVRWIENLLLGSVGTTVAIMAVASIGLMMLAGRLHLRHGLTVLAGCFVLFGSSTIVAGIQSSLVGSPADATRPAPQPRGSALPDNAITNPDPYAGASVPVR